MNYVHRDGYYVTLSLIIICLLGILSPSLSALSHTHSAIGLALTIIINSPHNDSTTITFPPHVLGNCRQSPPPLFQASLQIFLLYAYKLFSWENKTMHVSPL